MSIRFDGTTGYLEFPGAILTAYPISVSFWVAQNVNQTSVWGALNSSASLDRLRVLHTGFSLNNYAQTIASNGNAEGALRGLSPEPDTVMRHCVAVFTSASSRTLYFNDSTAYSNTNTLAINLAGINRLTIGADHSSAGVSAFHGGSIAEFHVYNAALTASDVAALVAKTSKPEQISGWVDGWTLVNAASLTSIGGTRTLTAVGGVSDTGAAAHPITRVVADTTLPVMTGTLTSNSVTSTAFTIDWSGTARSDNVAVTGYEVSTDSGTSWVNVNNVTSITYSNLASSTAFTRLVRAYDAAGNKSTPALSITVNTSAAPDTTVPTMTGTVTSNSVTSGGFTIDWSGTTRSDNVGITGYETSPDGGSTWVDRGNVTSIAFTGLTASTAYTRLVRAYDAAGNKSTPALSVTVTTSVSADTTVPVLAGSMVQNSLTQTSVQYSWPAGSDNVAVTGYEVSLDGTTYSNVGNVLTNTTNGLTASNTYTIRVRAYDAAGNRSTPPLTLSVTTPAAPDVTIPVMTGSLTSNTISSTGFTIDWSGTTRTDNVAVTGYETSHDNGTTWADRGNVTAAVYTGLGASTAYTRLVRAYDAAGNKSAALSISVTTLGAGGTITYAVAGKNINGGKRVGVAHSASVHNKTTRAIVAFVSNLTSDATTGLCNFTHAALTPGVEYLIVVSASADVKDTGIFWATAT